MNFFIVILIGLVSFAIIGFLSVVVGEPLKYILGSVGLAYLIFEIFFRKNSSNG